MRKKMRFRPLLLATLALWTIPAASSPPGGEEGRTSHELSLLMRAMDARTAAQKKLPSSFALELLRRGDHSEMRGLPEWEARIPFDSSNRVRVVIEGAAIPELETLVETLGGVVNHRGIGSLVAELGLEEIELLAEHSEVHKVRLPSLIARSQVNTTEGDVAHQAHIARATNGVDGQGVMVCVISNGVDSLVAVQNSGDLPKDVLVLPGLAGSGDEGTAMLEILHDLAPGASLGFATDGETIAASVASLFSLRKAGCQIIVGDFAYDPPRTAFQDNSMTGAIEAVIASGAHVFWAAGNRGSQLKGTSSTWEGDFRSLVVPIGDTHDFDGMGDNANSILIDDGRALQFSLEWADPRGESSNDYNLILLSSSGSIVATSLDEQNGDDDPVEAILSPDDDTGRRLVVARISGQRRYLRLTSFPEGKLEHGTAGAVAGATAAESAFIVAAVDVATANGGAFVGGGTNPVEDFSSDGPRRVFFDSSGVALTPGDFLSTGGSVRSKPDFAAADNVTTAAPGFSPFSGTSAAAPHVAAIAALILEIKPGISREDLGDLLTAAALDIEDLGTDSNSGSGIVRADLAVNTIAVIFNDGFESGDLSGWDNP